MLKFKRQNLRLSTKINKALNDGDSKSKKRRKIEKLRRRIVKPFTQRKRIRNIMLLASLTLSTGVVFYYHKPSRSLLISVVSKCKSMFVTPSQENLSSNSNTAIEMSDPSNANGKGITRDILFLILTLSLVVYKKLTKEAPIEIIEVPIPWWHISYPVRVISGGIMTCSGAVCMAFPSLQPLGGVLIVTGWQLATQGVPT